MIAIATDERPKRERWLDLRLALLRLLAPDGRCSRCGTRVGVRRLEIDHVHERTWIARELSKLDRSKRYWSEYLADVELRAACRSCNGSDGYARQAKNRKAA